MLKIKNGVKVNGMRPEILLALVIAERVYDSVGAECVITEITGGKHGRASLHYVGLAVDLRISNLVKSQLDKIIAELKDALGDEYDVVLESDHIHIEFQPK